MAAIDLSSFQRVARKNPQAEVLIDQNSGELRIRGGNVFDRTVSWIKDRFQDLRSPKNAGDREVLRRNEREAAHNGFIRAIGTSGRYRYEATEIQRVETMLAADIVTGTPLSARRVREVFGELNRICPEVLAENRALAAWVSGRADESRELERGLEAGLSQRPLLVDAEFEPSAAQKADLGNRIYQAVVAACNSETRMTFGEAAAIAEQVTAEFLDQREAAWVDLQAELARMSAISDRAFEAGPIGRDTSAATAESPTSPAGLPADGGRSEKAAVGSAAAKTAGNEGKAGGAGRPRLERGSANWVIANRLNRWYREAVGGAAKSSALVKAPEPLASRIRRQLGGDDPNRAPMPYDRIKTRGRAIVAEYVKEHDAKALHGALARAKLPADVEARVKSLMRKGAIHDRADLARVTNETLAEWVIEKRLGQWCFEALDKLRIPSGKQVLAPGKLISAVAEAISGQAHLAPYPEVKASARRLILEYVSRHPTEFRAESTPSKL